MTKLHHDLHSSHSVDEAEVRHREKTKKQKIKVE